MAHSGPDWGSAAPQATVEILLDLGELAARLGSPVAHDRRGKVFWLDDLSGANEGWNCVIVGASGDVGYNANIATQFNGLSIYIRAGPAENDYTAYFQAHGYPGLSSMGWESSFIYDSNGKAYEWALAVADGAYLVAAEIKYDCILGGFYYKDADNDWVLIKSGYFFFDDPDDFGWMFNVVKLVIDPVKYEYKRLIVNRWEFDLSGIACPSGPVVGAPFIYHVFTLRCGSAGNAATQIGYHVLTCEEP